MERSLLACFLLLASSCSVYPHPILPIRVAATADKCGEFVGPGWTAIEAPVNARELAAMAQFKTRPVGLLWYSSASGDYAVCAYTRDPDGCGYGAHYFTKQNGQWHYSPGNFLWRYCVLD
jgi:hypothetical protein